MDASNSPSVLRDVLAGIARGIAGEFILEGQARSRSERKEDRQSGADTRFGHILAGPPFDIWKTCPFGNIAPFWRSNGDGLSAPC